MREKIIRKSQIYTQESIFQISLQNREEVKAIKDRFPGKVPIIVRKCPWDHTLPELPKPSFIVSERSSIASFIYIVRNNLKIDSSKAIYLLINAETMVCLTSSIGEVYRQYSNPDGYLYIMYSSEETFG